MKYKQKIIKQIKEKCNELIYILNNYNLKIIELENCYEKIKEINIELSNP
jgi:hypothetical protein